MTAIILAAGIGKRLRPLKNNIPKTLVPVNVKPLIERQTEYLKEIGVKEIEVVTGYLREKFNYLRTKYATPRYTTTSMTSITTSTACISHVSF